MQNDFDKGQYLMIINFLQIEYPSRNTQVTRKTKSGKAWTCFYLFPSDLVIGKFAKVQF